MFDESERRSPRAAEPGAAEETKPPNASFLATSCELEDFAAVASPVTTDAPASAMYATATAVEQWPAVHAGTCLSKKLESPPASEEDAAAATTTLEYPPLERQKAEAPGAGLQRDFSAPSYGGLQSTSVPSAAVAARTSLVATGVATSCCSSGASSPFFTSTQPEEGVWKNCNADGGGYGGPSLARKAVISSSAAAQLTPFGLNRYLLLLMHVLYVFASARVLFGWPNLSNMLFRSGAYAWLCNGEDGKFTPRPPTTGGGEEGGGHTTRYLCRSQDNAVQLLFTVGMATSFCCSLVAGLLMDWRGPRLCAAVGQLLNTAGWILLSVASESFQTYIPAFLCLALGADAGYLPSMTVSNLFPGHEGLVVVLLSAAMSASFSIPTLMDFSWRQHPLSLSFRTVGLLYAAFGTGLCSMIALLLFPSRPYANQEEIDRRAAAAVAAAQPEEETDSSKSGVPILPGASSSTCVGVTVGVEAEGEKVKEENEVASPATTATTPTERRGVPTGSDTLSAAGEAEGLTGSAAAAARCKTVEKSSSEVGGVESSSNGDLLPFRRQLLSPYFLCFFVYWPLNALFYNYYLTSAENMFNREVNDLLGILGPLSMIPSVLLGKLVDAYGVMSLVLFISSSAVCMYFFALLPAAWAHIVSAVFSCLYVSNFSGQMYAYMQDTFRSADFGKVVGLTSAAGGLLALLRIPLHDHFTVSVLRGNYRQACGLMLGTTLFCLLLALRLFFLKRKKNKAYIAYAITTPTGTGAAAAAVAACDEEAEEKEEKQMAKDIALGRLHRGGEICEV